mmetsp:Transcript_8247/g.27747  ORF Transcript_8247/g.27747 Transcript_8247/m.27747 type:complete len:110 (-) Transcript_8247:1053-1382(-)
MAHWHATKPAENNVDKSNRRRDGANVNSRLPLRVEILCQLTDGNAGVKEGCRNLRNGSFENPDLEVVLSEVYNMYVRGCEYDLFSSMRNAGSSDDDAKEKENKSGGNVP